MFNYQIVFKEAIPFDSKSIVVAGSTSLNPCDLLDSIVEEFSIKKEHYELEGFSYLPQKFDENGTKETT